MSLRCLLNTDLPTNYNIRNFAIVHGERGEAFIREGAFIRINIVCPDNTGITFFLFHHENVVTPHYEGSQHVLWRIKSNLKGPLIICCVGLRPRQTAKVMLGRSVNLTTLFLGRFRASKGFTNTHATFRQYLTDNCPS